MEQDPLIRKMFNELRILYPLAVYPEKSGAYLRTFNIASLVSELFDKTTIFAMDENTEFTGILEGINVCQKKKYERFKDKITYYAQGLFSRDFSCKTPPEAFYNKGESLFQIEGPFFYNQLKRQNIKNYVLNEHNLYWEYFDFPAYTLKSKIYNKLAFKRDKLIEIEALKNAAYILVCSDRDKQVLNNEVSDIDHKIEVIPNYLNLSDYTNYPEIDVIDEKRINILFMGLLSYPPNLDAFNSIRDIIAPTFRGEVHFTIIGKNPPNVDLPKNMECLGHVKDIKQYVSDSDICIAPLRYGSGTRFKILEYMAMGKPVISTSKGAEGIDYTDGKNIIIEDDISLFALRIQELVSDEFGRKRMGLNACKLIEEKYDSKIYKRKLQSLYSKL